MLKIFIIILLYITCAFQDNDDLAVIYGDLQRPSSSFITVGIVDHHHHVLRYWEEAVREGTALMKFIYFERENSM